jgi:Arc/MetJ family transcription regulator
MRTTLDIDDALLKALLERVPGATKTEAIETAIEAYVAAGARRRLRELAGTLEIDDASAELRRT